MPNQKKISIALATYNGSKYILELLASLDTQTLPPQRVIIMDDCSTDATWDIVNSFSTTRFSIERYRNERNLGVTKTFKKLVYLCGQDYIAFCDQDDIWLPKKLEKCYSALLNIDDGHTPAVVYSDLQVIDSKGVIKKRSFWETYKINIDTATFKKILFGNIITGCTTLINSPMAEEFLKMPDTVIMYDYWMALIAFGIGKYTGIKAPQIKYRDHVESVTVKNKKSKLSHFFDELKKKPDYLKAELQQAELFHSFYNQQLSNEALLVLEEFIGLNKKPFFYKKINRYAVTRIGISTRTNR